MFSRLQYDDQEVTEIESLCMNCEQNGLTKMFLTHIPYFKEVIVMAFSCPHCNFCNNEIQSASEIQIDGVQITCKVNTKADLGRQVVKAASSVVIVKELELEVPPSQNQNNAVLTTIEGLLDRIIDDLSDQQEHRKSNNPKLYDQLCIVIDKLKMYMEGNEPFTLILKDISGNSFIENPLAPQNDPQLVITHFSRSGEENEFLGLSRETQEKTNDEIIQDLKDEIHEFASNCGQCKAPCPTRMKMINIPHFKEVVIMSTACDYCGYKSNEVKSGGAISDKGKIITLKITCEDDLSRDILKSETSGLSIPEIDLELTSGTLGGKFTTIEGILTEIRSELGDKTPFQQGDGAVGDRKAMFATFLNKLQALTTFTTEWTIILDDPMSNSYIQNLYAPDSDPNLTSKEYKRTKEQDDFYGVSDMKV